MTKIIELKAEFKKPANNVNEPSANQRIVAMRGELKQLTTDFNDIASGQAGSTFTKGVKAKLNSWITALKSILEALDATASAGR